MGYSYRPTDRPDTYAMVSGPVVLLVDSPLSREECWDAVRASDVRGVLDALAAAGISGTPDFALIARTEAGLHVVVRGMYVVEAGESVSGDGVSSWLERTIPGATDFTVSRSDESGGDLLPIVGGVVTAGGVAFSDRDDHVEPLRLVVLEAGSVADAAPPQAEDVTTAAVELVADDATVVLDRGQPGVRPAAPSAGDHDGETVFSEELARLRTARGTGGPAPSVPTQTPAPAVPAFSLVLPDGRLEALDRRIIVGRAPSVNQVSGARVPRLVAIHGDEDVSRNHVQFDLEGDTVVVTDLHSRNGTVVRIPDRAALQLRPGEPTAVLVDTIVDLGGDSVIRILGS